MTCYMLNYNDCMKINITDISNHCYRYYNSFVRLMTLSKSFSLFVREGETIQMLKGITIKQ
jgi:hypothetical protein